MLSFLRIHLQVDAIYTSVPCIFFPYIITRTPQDSEYEPPLSLGISTHPITALRGMFYFHIRNQCIGDVKTTLQPDRPISVLWKISIRRSEQAKMYWEVYYGCYTPPNNRKHLLVQ
jgi:hypothetical protein